jgi:hypothetical protein
VRAEGILSSEAVDPSAWFSAAGIVTSSKGCKTCACTSAGAEDCERAGARDVA